MNKKLLTALVATACFAGTAFAFKTEFFGAAWLTSYAGVPIHEEITSEALSSITVLFDDGTSAKLKPEFIDALAEENTENDEAGLIYGQMHFDDSRLAESAAYVWNAKQAAITAFNNGNPAVNLPNSLRIDGNGVQTNLGSAMHTIQDFFAHSTWTEINTSRSAAGTPVLPVPRIGMIAYPFSEGTFASLVKLDVAATFGSPGQAISDNVCDVSSVVSPASVLSSAYYDFAMSATVDLGFFTDNWVGFPQSTELLSISPPAKITWPYGRCVHGGDGPSARGINKDKSDRAGYPHARKAAVQATRAFMLDFLASANVLATSNKATVCQYMLNCRDAVQSRTETPSNFTVTDVQSQATFGNVTGKVLQIQADHWPARMLSYTYDNVACTVFRPWRVDDDTDATYDKVICPSTRTGPADLKIFQTARPQNVLHTIRFALNASTAPAVSGIQPTSAASGVARQFTVAGTNLPGSIVMTIGGSVCSPPQNLAATGFTTTCTVRGTTGSQQQVVITDTSTGAVIDSSKVITVSSAGCTAPQILVNGVCVSGTGTAPQIAKITLTAGTVSRLEVQFDQPMLSGYYTTGSYSIQSQTWETCNKYVMNLSSYSPGGFITFVVPATVHGGFVSANGIDMAQTVQFQFPQSNALVNNSYSITYSAVTTPCP